VSSPSDIRKETRPQRHNTSSSESASSDNIFGYFMWRVIGQYHEYISSALISLHWLRIPERISFKLAVLTYRATHGAAWTELFPVLLHSLRRHAVTTTAFVRLLSLARTDHSSIHSRQSHIQSFRRRGMERPAGSRHHSCAVTRGL